MKHRQIDFWLDTMPLMIIMIICDLQAIDYSVY